MTRRAAALTGLMVLFSYGCGTSDDAYQMAASGLCQAALRAGAGEAAPAAEVFYDHVHQPLHELAAQTSEVDRSLAARLLEAKEAVEAGLTTPEPDLGAGFRTLVAATDEALMATGHDGVSCSAAAGAR